MKYKWLKISIIIIIIGFVLYAIDYILYIPKISALYEATLAWANAWPENPTNSTMPTLEMFGLDTTALIASKALGTMAYALLSIGWFYVIIFFLGKLLTKFSHQKQP